MAETEEAPTLGQLESVIGNDPGPESVHDALAEAMKDFDHDAQGGEDQESEDAEATSDDGDQGPENEAEQDGEDAEGGEENEAEALEPPLEWSAADHDAFHALTPEAQKFVLDRVQTLNSNLGEAKETAAKYDALDSVLAPHRGTWERSGLDEVQGVKQLLATWKWAADNPAEFAAWFAQQSGIAQSDGRGQQEQQAETGVDLDQFEPEVAQIFKKYDSVIERLEKQVESLGGTVNKQAEQFQHQETEAERRQNEAADAAISDFASAKDDKGKLTHPHFDDVAEMVGYFLHKGFAKDLEIAYDMACRADPDVSAKIESGRKARETQANATKSREKAAKASKAGSSVASADGAASAARPSSKGSTYDDLAETMAEAGMV